MCVSNNELCAGKRKESDGIEINVSKKVSVPLSFIANKNMFETHKLHSKRNKYFHLRFAHAQFHSSYSKSQKIP